MKKRPKTWRNLRPVDLAVLVAEALTGRWDPSYRPTLTDEEMATAFDTAMKTAGNPLRAWRGGK